MEPKCRSFPPAVPVKMCKLFEYEYLAQIYRKYDCNFFREILPYFSEILTTNKLEIFKFIYIPIENPHKVPGIHIGTPFKLQVEIKNRNFYELSREVSFIKIAYQTHVIFEYLINLNLSNVSIHRMKFQDKFWLLSESVLKNFYFGDVVYRKDSRNENGVWILVEGEFKCLNEDKKLFKTIGKGYLIDIQGKLKKVKFDEKTYTDKINFDESAIPYVTRNSQFEILKQEKCDQTISVLLSNSNTAKVLFISLPMIKKYCPNFEEKTGKNSPVKESINKEKKIMKPEFRSQLQKQKKIYRVKTETEQSPDKSVDRRSFDHGIYILNPAKKFNLISCRTINSMDEIFNNEVLKSYTKDKELYQKMLKQMSQREKRQKKFFSSDEKDRSLDRKQQLMPFFKQELKEEKEKVIIKRRKTKELWGHSSVEKQNFLANAKKIVEELDKEKNVIKNFSKPNKLMKKVGKTEIAAFQLLKRNMFNKQYHRVNFVQMHS